MDARTAFTDTELVYVSFTRAWALLTDWDAAPVWMPGVDHMYAEGRPELGMAIDFTAGGHERTATITALEPEDSLTLTMSSGDVRTDYRYELAQDGDNVRVSLTVDVVVDDDLASMAAEIRESVADADGGQLQQFKEYAEASP
ncbi:SRPBCC family protein [Arthrobacter castelli]|uniref:SRPBCC family protein n=1 Tax=Arthrobacter castelli TaxID=271431 RepID=UPI00042698D0|nr:SRPBCC family protein [Arthrobacter castelli]